MKRIIFTALLLAVFGYCQSQPQLIRTLAQQYSSSGSWVDSAEEHYHYYSKNLVEHVVTNDLSGSTKRVWFIDSNKYDINNRIETIERYNKNLITNTLDIITTTNYTYAGSVLNKKEEIFRNRTLVYNYTYNTNSKLIEEEFDIFKNVYTYNSSGYIETVTRQVYANGAWQNSSRDSLIYSSNKKVASHKLLWQGQTTKSWVFMLETKFLYNTNGTLKESQEQTASGTKTWRTLYFYKNSTTSIEDFATKENMFKIYPNPSSGKFTVELDDMELSTITITGVTGKQVYRTEASNNLDVNLSHLQKGIYLVNIKNKENSSTKRIVVQ